MSQARRYDVWMFANAIAEDLERFIADSSELDAAHAEQRLLPILRELLAHDGFTLIEEVRPDSVATDYLATSSDDAEEISLGIEYKHYGQSRPADVQAIDQVILSATRRELDRVVLLSRSGFTNAALRAAASHHPVELELLDYDGLRGWLARVDKAGREPHSRVVKAIEALSRELALAVADNSAALDALEWRDLERMMAVVLARLGFDAELTPASKDGGKDIRLTLREENNVLRSYVVELKHWRSGKHVGSSHISDFVQVVAREGHECGLFIATYGYTSDAFAALTEVQRMKVRIGSQRKVVDLCRTYVKAETGLWSPTGNLPDLLFKDTE